MINFDDVTGENTITHNPDWPEHPYTVLIIGGSGSGKTNSSLNLIRRQPDSDKIYQHEKQPHEAKCQLLINKRRSVGLKHYNGPKPFIQYSIDMVDIYKNIDKYSLGKERKVVVFHNMIADTIFNKKLLTQ